MLAIDLIWRIWRVKQIAFTVRHTILRNFITLNNKFAKLKGRHLVQIVKIANLISLIYSIAVLASGPNLILENLYVSSSS